MVGGIYAIRNQSSGKVYVGQTSDFSRRWEEHLRSLRAGSHYNRRLQNAWLKYGEENFSFDILEEGDQDLDTREAVWAEALDALQSGYNLRTLGDSPVLRGVGRSEEFRLLISQKRREYLQKFPQKHSLETRKKMSQTRREMYEDPEYRQAHRDRGRASGRSGVSDPEVVKQIRREYVPHKYGEVPRLSQKFGVSVNVIEGIVYGYTYKDVTDE